MVHDARPPTEVIYGVRAALAVLDRRPNDIVSVAFAAPVVREVDPLVRWAAENGVRCAEVSEPDLEALARSRHHEGLAVEARERQWVRPRDLAERLSAEAGTAVALDRVRNPYNVGAILRTAAFFGVRGALLGAPAPHPGVAPEAVRVAEGGVEHLLVSRTTDLADTLARFRGLGIHVVGAEARAKQSAFAFRFARPILLVVGHEREGLLGRVRDQCEATVSVPGVGAVESLNVSVAAGLLMAEVARRRELGGSGSIR